MATEPTSGEPHSSRIASWIGNVDIAGEYFDMLHLFFLFFCSNKQHSSRCVDFCGQFR